MSEQINPNNGIPLYKQIFTDLEKRITTGEFSDTNRFPSEKMLCEEYGASRITIRHAVDMLTQVRLISKKQGQGTFVVDPNEQYVSTGYMSFTSTCLLNGKTPGALFRSLSQRSASEKECEMLHCKDVAVLSRIRTIDNEPVVIEEITMPSDYIDSATKDLTGSFSENMKSFGIIIANIRREIEICYANDVEASILQLEPGTPLLLLHEKLLSRDNTILFLVKNVVSTAKFPYFLL